MGSVELVPVFHVGEAPVHLQEALQCNDGPLDCFPERMFSVNGPIIFSAQKPRALCELCSHRNRSTLGSKSCQHRSKAKTLPAKFQPAACFLWPSNKPLKTGVWSRNADNQTAGRLCGASLITGVLRDAFIRAGILVAASVEGRCYSKNCIATHV